ncbi:hypothetical protein R1flu_006521 [Riccia fluitans]|uniref:Uncharacterized protein n=1 Tax=Riccia fluitans TaxID=41844 RepID=A0ABD1YW83_9MARC
MPNHVGGREGEGELMFLEEPQLNKNARNKKPTTQAKREAAKAEKEKLMTVKEGNPRRKLEIGDLDKSIEKSPKKIKWVEKNVPNSPAPSVDNAQDSPMPPPSPPYNTQQKAQQHRGEPKGNIKAKRKRKISVDEIAKGQEKAFGDVVKVARKESIIEASKRREKLKNGADVVSWTG